MSLRLLHNTEVNAGGFECFIWGVLYYDPVQQKKEISVDDCTHKHRDDTQRERFYGRDDRPG